MAEFFDIRSNTVGSFLDRRPSFPRFQRKSTWRDEDRFRLVLSVYKGYPLGTVVVKQSRDSTSDATTYSLLDGRQRYETLASMLNPEQLWYWAKAALGINTKTTPDDLVTRFKEYIDNYFFGREDWEEEEPPLDAQSVVTTEDLGQKRMKRGKRGKQNQGQRNPPIAGSCQANRYLIRRFTVT